MLTTLKYKLALWIFGGYIRTYTTSIFIAVDYRVSSTSAIDFCKEKLVRSLAHQLYHDNLVEFTIEQWPALKGTQVKAKIRVI